MAIVGRLFGAKAPFVPADAIDTVLAEGTQGREVLLLDVRNAVELAESGTIPGAIHICLDELADRAGELPRDRPVLTA